jgi:hypothetical protein
MGCGAAFWGRFFLNALTLSQTQSNRVKVVSWKDTWSQKTDVFGKMDTLVAINVAAAGDVRAPAFAKATARQAGAPGGVAQALQFRWPLGLVRLC